MLAVALSFPEPGVHNASCFVPLCQEQARIQFEDETGLRHGSSNENPECLGRLHEVRSSVKFFSKLNNLFFGYFDPINNFFDNKNT